ncbi:Chromosome transmission fidelity protein 18 [Yamadazyma tenuis]|uniref:p-loop containing nucleoside triphosphate hydrolase protein n=1 Tax=Candida tenuis (strain ATCC 10573 / BCRC 21748 / CBS 615 / JCM 9827 / NBRC 10315 / NRRL Y-1498 / VKM Y-70) TaxID=590646 RepID=G3B923_CANTC|nr:P-loop containing nucleoside triphosphate hydrolase protein [Yamadazyma tenuis ATCC 10573]EGV62443.1 P-loop containing nucleoside triphosphate hydrolase protein [Yamadazyma tenuis ATCC 10573]WEJ93727.1 Chromosome transmission fidelity protein 18 [Yamadazyma tenuis]
MLEQPLSLDFSDSPLFSQVDSVVEKTSNTFEMSTSLLFGAPDSSEKEVKLFNGSTIKLKKKVAVPALQESELSNEGMSIIDMDLLFQKAKQRQTYKDNQKQAAATSNSKPVHKPTHVWTEQYRPQRFVQLCSAGNDRQYRMISHWLKKWSGVVYNEAFDDDEGNIDSLGRPMRKFLLISGPSGIGKTAAAHIIAKQLGYNVEELNAANSMNSLPNSNSSGNNYTNVVNSLKLKIQNALTSNSIQSKGNKISTNSKPTCLIIDEIDTAGNSSDIIRVLNEIHQSDQRAFNQLNNKNVFGNSNSKSKRKDQLLNRPIICIANDAFTTSSRTYGGFNMDKLRNMSELVTFQKPTIQKTNSGMKIGGKALKSVKEYIKWISDKENLKLGFQEIGEIVEICEGDIRACINHLQFNGRKVQVPMIEGAHNKSTKDLQLSWFKIAEMIFKRDPSLSKEADFGMLMETIMNGAGKSVSASNSTLDKVIRACFNRYLDSVHYQDDSLVKPCELSDWLDFYDKVGNSNDALDYASLVSMKFWVLFSESNPNRVSKSLIPDIKNLEYESNEMKKVNKSIIKSFISNLPVEAGLSLGGGFENNESFGLFVLPLIHKIISPEMTSSGGSISLSMKSKSSLSDFDQDGLVKAAKVIKDFGIQLESLRDTTTNLTSLEFYPNLDSLVLYNSDYLKTPIESTIKQIQARRKWMFPLLQTELEREDVVRLIEKRKAVQLGAVDSTKSNKKQKTTSLEFFKGQYDGLSTHIQQAKDKVDSEATRIWVKYNEGFSNAVRKNIGWNDLWIA